MLLPFIFFFVLKLSCGYSISKNYDWRDIPSTMFQKPINNGSIPIHYDYRDGNKVSPVKNQKNCNAGWAFSVIANIESNLMIHQNIQETLSEQHLIDCDVDDHGCQGYGHVGSALATILFEFEGVIREKDYPYRNSQSECKTPHLKPHYIAISGFNYIEGGDEEDMVKALFRYGPLSAGINSKSMSSGKYAPKTIDQPSDEDCPKDKLDHAVLIVGYNVYVDKDKEIPYWIIKNSWGKDWGDEGYYYLERGRNACGIAKEVAYATV